jgi:hypothetical protein
MQSTGEGGVTDAYIGQIGQDGGVPSQPPVTVSDAWAPVPDASGLLEASMDPTEAAPPLDAPGAPTPPDGAPSDDSGGSDDAATGDAATGDDATGDDASGGGGTLRCGGTSCNLPDEYCCLRGQYRGGQTSTCTSRQNDCNGPSATPIRCSSSSQCGGGESCCGTLFDGNFGQYYSEISCRNTCSGGGGPRQYQFCDPAIPGDCPPNLRCVPSTVVDGYNICNN